MATDGLHPVTESQRIAPQYRFFSDHNFNEDILRAVARLDWSIDILRAREAGMAEAPDEEILERAAQEGRLTLSHDVNTLRRDAYSRLIAGRPMPGLFLVTKGQPIEPVARDIALLAVSSIEGEWENQVRFLPFR